MWKEFSRFGIILGLLWSCGNNATSTPGNAELKVLRANAESTPLPTAEPTPIMISGNETPQKTLNNEFPFPNNVMQSQENQSPHPMTTIYNQGPSFSYPSGQFQTPDFFKAPFENNNTREVIYVQNSDTHIQEGPPVVLPTIYVSQSPTVVASATPTPLPSVSPTPSPTPLPSPSPTPSADANLANASEEKIQMSFYFLTQDGEPTKENLTLRLQSQSSSKVEIPAGNENPITVTVNRVKNTGVTEDKAILSRTSSGDVLAIVPFSLNESGDVTQFYGTEDIPLVFLH